MRLDVTGLDEHGVRLISPADRRFDGLARFLIGERVADVILGLRPMLAIVENDTDRTIVSLSLIWHITHGDGRTTKSWTHASFPSMVCGDVVPGRDQEGLLPRARRIEADGVVVHGWGAHDPYYDQFIQQFVDRKNDLMADAAELRIQLDAVILDDGRLVGPDEGALLRDLFTAYVNAKKTWYRQIADAFARGESVDGAFGSVDAFMRATAERLRAGEFRRQEPNAIWVQQGAAEARMWSAHHDGEDIRALFERTIRLDPFVVTRQ